MEALDADAITARLRPHLEAAGLKIVSVTVRPYDEAPFDGVPVADFFVELPDGGGDAVHARMLKAEASLRKALRPEEPRCGYYDRSIGYDAVPKGQAMIEIDGLPFTLARPASPGP